MSKTTTCILILSAIFACASVASAQEEAQPQPHSPQPSVTTQESAVEPTPAVAQQSEPATIESAATKTVPALNIVWNCGKCEQNPKIVPLIVERYIAEADKAGFSVSTTDVANAEITDFRQRNPGLRVMFGVMGGKDRLQLKLMHNAAPVMVGDSSANAIQGQNALCADVAKQMFQILSGVQAKR